MTDIDPLDQAVYDTVHDFVDERSGRKGCVALAETIGMRSSTLANKASRKEEHAHLNLHEARSVMLATGDVRILEALANSLGYACVPLPTIAATADMDLLDAWAKWSAEFGETAATIKQALEDGRIEHHEIAEVRRELIEDFEKGLAIIDVLKGMAEPETDKVIRFK